MKILSTDRFIWKIWNLEITPPPLLISFTETFCTPLEVL